MSMIWLGVKEWEAATLAVVVAASAGARQAVAEASSKLEARAKDNASGAPGPGVVTGTLRRGIRTDPIKPSGVNGWETTVAPRAIYSRRVELGFNGPDALGRVYNQAPSPYFEPAFEQTRAEMPEIYLRNWRQALVG